MKKKIFSLLITLCMCFTMLVGCNIFTINQNKYYNQIVASVNGHNFTMIDLLDAYDMYGKDILESDPNGSVKKAVEGSLDRLIEKQLFLDYIKSNEKFADIATLTVEDKNDIKLSVYQSVQSQLTQIEKEIKIERGLIKEGEDGDGQTDSNNPAEGEGDKDKFRTFDKKFIYNGEIEKEEDRYQRNVKPNKDYGVDPGEFVQVKDIAYPDISEEAARRYVKLLQANARKYNKSDKVEDVKKAEYDRLTKFFTETKYMNKLEEKFMNNINNYKEDVVESYAQKYLEDYVTYNKNNKKYNEFMSGKAAEYTADTYYHPETNYMVVAHILLKVDESVENKESVEFSYTENGVEKKATINEIYARISNEMNQCTTLEEKAEKFYELLYIFNEDEGIENKEFGYLIPIDVAKEGASDTMIKEFAEDSRKLNKEQKEGGNFSEAPVLGQYGYHIIFNMGELTNLLPYEIIKEYKTNTDLIFKTLFHNRVQPFLDKSWFDKVYEENINEENMFNQFATELTETSKSGADIKKYEQRYKTLWS